MYIEWLVEAMMLVKIWNIKSKVCVKTIKPHLDKVSCLVRIKKYQFASGGSDRNINIGYLIVSELMDNEVKND